MASTSVPSAVASDDRVDQAMASASMASVCQPLDRVLTYNQMVVGLLSSDAFSEAEADQVFHALADSTRRDILARAIEHEQSVSALARH